MLEQEESLVSKPQPHRASAIPRGISVADLRCPKCQKTIGECPPDKCEDPECPQKPQGG